MRDDDLVFRQFVNDDKDSPCVKCAHRSNMYCNFYQSELLETFGVIRPCCECEDDSD